MNKLKTITDFIVWLLFTSTLLLTITLLATGTYYLIVNPTWQTLNLFGAAIITLGIHYAIRMMPVSKGK